MGISNNECRTKEFRNSSFDIRYSFVFMCLFAFVSLCLCAFGQTSATPDQVGGEPSGPLEIVIDALKSNDPAMQAGAVSMVKELPGKEVTEALAKELPNLSAAGQVQLLSALADRGDPTALPAVVSATGSSNESVRVAALKAIGLLGDASNINLLAQKAALVSAERSVAGQSSGAEQKAARESLYRLRGQEVDQYILKAIASAQRDIKIELIQSVAQRNIVSGADVLIQTAQDSDSRIQQESFKALRAVADEKHLPALVQLLVDLKNDSVRSEAERTVAAVARKIKDKNRQAEFVLTMWYGLEARENTAKPVPSAVEGMAVPPVNDVTGRCSLLNVLGQIGDNAALPALRTALTNDNAKIHDTAVRALCNWPGAAVTEDLLKIARTTAPDLIGSQVHRILALRALVRLTGLESSQPAEQTLKMYQQLMDLAPNVQEKRIVLSGLANTKSLAALHTAAGYMQNETLQQEAEAAVVSIAEGIFLSYPQQTKDVLNKMLQISKNDLLRQRASGIINRIDNPQSEIEQKESEEEL